MTIPSKGELIHYPVRTQKLSAKKVQPDAGRRYWIQELGAEVDIGDIGEELGQMETEVKIAFPVSHNTLTIVEEYVQ